LPVGAKDYNPVKKTPIGGDASVIAGGVKRTLNLYLTKISKCQTEDEKSEYELGISLVRTWYNLIMGGVILKKKEKLQDFLSK